MKTPTLPVRIKVTQTSQFSIEVRTYNAATGAEITGMWTVLRDANNNVLKDGVFSPVTFGNLPAGTSYIVEVDSFGQTVFARWDNGSTNRFRPVNSIASNQSLKAYYNVASPPPPSGDMGVIIFAYFGYYGQSVWNRIFASKQQYPDVNIIVVSNPASGFNPGDLNQRAQVRDTCTACHQYGIPVIGYIGTGFADGPGRVQYVKDLASAYKQYGPVDGIFLDETNGCPSCSNAGGAYQQMADYIHGIGLRYAVGNPGGFCSSSGGQDRYFDIVCMWEDPRTFSISDMQNCPVPRSKKAAIPHSQGTKDLNKISNALNHVGYYYEVTQDNAWHVVGAFPPWFEDIVRIVHEKLQAR